MENIMLTSGFFDKFTTEELNAIIAIAQSVKSSRSEVLPVRIKDSDVSIRCMNSLMRIDIYQWYELSNFTLSGLNRIRCIGKKTMAEIMQELKKRNIILKG
jgi:DNA-directed RNA polymerase alpha subunit